MNRSSPRKFLFSRGMLLIWLCALASLSAPLSRFVPADRLPHLQWILELAAHWQLAYAVTGAACFFLLLAITRSWWPMLPALLLGASFFTQAARLERVAEPIDGRPILTIGTANLNFNTRDFRSLTAWLLSPDAPDLVFLQEYTIEAQKALATADITSRYPYRLEAPQQDQFGLALLSRHVLQDEQRLESDDTGATLRLRAEMQWQGVPVHLSALHPMPPLDPGYAKIRDRMLREESDYLAQKGGLALMAGDFNTTPWVKSLIDIESGMRRANGVMASWPNAAGWLSILPIDHVLASFGWAGIGSSAGPDLGSDHRPIVVRLSVAE